MGNWGYSPTYRSYKPHFVTGRGPPLARFLPCFFWMLPRSRSTQKKRFLLLMEDCNVLTVHHLGCFWTNWVTAAFQKRITSWGSQNKGTTSIFETSILSTKAFHPLGKVHFFFEKQGAEVYLVQWIFDGLKRSPLQNIEPNLGDVPGLCPDQSNSHWVPNPQKTGLFLMNFFRGYFFVHKKIITTKSTQREKQKIPSVLNSGWPNKCSLPQDHSLKVSPQNRMGVSKLPCWLWYW